MKELLKKEMKYHNRDKVVDLLKAGALEQFEGEEAQRVCMELVALRDKQIVEVLAKQQESFDISMLKLNLENWNNREFVNYILNKYTKKFNWDDDATCEELFEIACKTENKKILQSLIKQKKAVSKYPELASSGDAVFSLISKVKTEELDNELIVEFIVQAAVSGKEAERLKTLKEKGFEITTQNEQGEMAHQVLEKRIQEIKYPKNRSGALKRKRDQAAIQYLCRVENGLVVEEEKTVPKKKIIGYAIASVAVLAIGIGIGIATYQSSKNTDYDADGVAYNTDTSQTVEDGDTVNIDYVGTVDGVEFDGGNTNGTGTSLTIGSGSYIDDFEEQLIGHYVGETVTVNVTFPEDYGNDELNGKEAEFEVVINGIYE